MEITYFKERVKTFTHDVTIIINDKILEYTVDSVKRNGKYYTAGYHKKQITKLKTSERKKIKKYFENDFLERAEAERNNEASGLHLHNVSGSVLFADWIAKKMQADSWFRYRGGSWYIHTVGHLTTEELYAYYLKVKN
jgi:hypothetical protein